MTISGISNNVQALLTATDYFKTVLASPPNKSTDFAGYPSACHYYVNAESNYATVSQNRRVIEYVVEIYATLADENPTVEELAEIYALTDNTIQMFDETIDLSSTSLGLSRACDLMRPTPAQLEAVSTSEGPGILVTIRLFCEGDVTFRNM